MNLRTEYFSNDMRSEFDVIRDKLSNFASKSPKEFCKKFGHRFDDVTQFCQVCNTTVRYVKMKRDLRDKLYKLTGEMELEDLEKLDSLLTTSFNLISTNTTINLRGENERESTGNQKDSKDGD